MFLIAKATETWRDGISSSGIKKILTTAMLSVALSCTLAGHGQTKIDTIYSDPAGRFLWIRPAEQVAGLDVEIWACHAHLKNKGQSDSLQDTTILQFFIPASYPLIIEIREKNHLSELRPGMQRWPEGFFQCLRLPNTILRNLSLAHSKLLTVGKVQEPNRTRIIPVARHAQLRDSLDYYEYKLTPNRDIEEKHSIFQEIESGNWIEVMPSSKLKFRPGREPFTIQWNGLIRSQPASEGNYRLFLEGIIYERTGTDTLARSFYFYHKPIFEPCLTPPKTE